MDDFEIQILVAGVAALLIGYPVEIIKRRQYLKEGRSIQYLTLKVFFFIGFPILSIPALLSEVFPVWAKLSAMVLVAIVAFLDYVSINLARKTGRRFLGLPPEDEHTGEVIKDDEKKE